MKQAFASVASHDVDLEQKSILADVKKRRCVLNSCMLASWPQVVIITMTRVNSVASLSKDFTHSSYAVQIACTSI